jgi:hypothetical protein
LGKPVDDYSDWEREIFLPVELPAPQIVGRPGADATRLGFALHVWVRMLFSALCDADFLDTEAFYAEAYSRPLERRPRHTLHALARQLDGYLAEKMAEAEPTEVNRIRAEVLAAVGEQTRLKPGLFTLTMPTGGWQDALLPELGSRPCPSLGQGPCDLCDSLHIDHRSDGSGIS